MPKLFPWKKGKKKTKPSIRDAIAPSTAFIAVPTTPPPILRSGNQINQSDQFSLPSPLPRTTQHTVVDTRQSNATHIPNERVVTQNGPSQGMYSLAAPDTDYSDSENEDPGYSRVRTMMYKRPRLPSPRHSKPITSLPPSHCNSSTQVTSLPPPYHNSSTQVTSLPPAHPHNQPSKPPANRILSTSDLPSVSSALSIHSDSTNISYGLSRDSVTRPRHNITSPVNTPVPVEADHKVPGKATVESREDTSVEAMYSKVCKTKGRKQVEAVPVTYTYVRHTKAHNASIPGAPNHLYHTLEPSEEHQVEPPLTKHTRRKLFTHQPKMKYKSQSVDNLTKQSKKLKRAHHQRRSAEASRTPHQKEYIDHALTNQESSSSLSSYSYSDEPTSPIYPHEQVPHNQSSYAINPPSHYPPSDKKYHNRHKRAMSIDTTFDHPVPRAKSAPPPVIQPSFIRQQGSVYVFSEQLPDGSVQFYSATPVQDMYTPTTQAHTSTQTIHPHSHTPTQYTPSPIVSPHSHPSSLPITHNSKPSSGIRTDSPNFAESGYFSNPLLTDRLTPVKQETGSVLISSVKPGGTGAATLITPLGATQSSKEQAKECGTSTHVQLLQSSVDSATQVDSTVLSQFPSAVASVKGNSPAVTDERDSPNQHLIAQYKAKEVDLRVRNSELEGVNKELKRENSTLQKRLDDVMTQSNSSNEACQSRLRTLSSENSQLREANARHCAKLSQLKSEVSQQREELSVLTNENQVLLLNQQATLEERGEWQRVANQAHTVLGENTALLKAHEAREKTIRELKTEYQGIVSGLNAEISQLRKERHSTDDALNALKLSHAQLLEQFEKLSAQSLRQVSLEEHQGVLAEVQRLVQELDETNKRELKSQEAQMRISDKDKHYLVKKLTDAKAIIYQLEGEVAQLHKAHKRSHDKMMELQRELEQTRDREVTLHSQLSVAVLSAEKAASERDTFARIARSQEQAKERVVIRGVKREVSMEKKLEAHKQEQLEQTSKILREQDKDHQQQRDQYRQEIGHLKSLLAKKQTCVDRLIRETKGQ